MSTDELVALITAAFRDTPHPGDAVLQGSFEGDEPFAIAAAFAGKHNWGEPTAAFLDQHYTALSFLSEAGLRFWLPAYLCADVRGELKTADPLFGLIHGFSVMQVELPNDAGEVTLHRSGGDVLLGPPRYGAMTWEDASRHRLSVFCREEAAAIVAYLHWRTRHDDSVHEAPRITVALDRFWRDRAEHAPTHTDLAAYGRPA